MAAPCVVRYFRKIFCFQPLKPTLLSTYNFESRFACYGQHHRSLPLLTADCLHWHHRPYSQSSNSGKPPPLKKPYTPVGKHDNTSEKHRDSEKEPLEAFPDDINPVTGEKGGPRGPEPTRYGDWECKGRCIDF